MTDTPPTNGHDDSDAAFGNRLYPPITDLLYADSLALRSHMESYDYIVSQPTVLSPEASARWREIVATPGPSLTDPPLPLDEFDV